MGPSTSLENGMRQGVQFRDSVSFASSPLLKIPDIVKSENDPRMLSDLCNLSDFPNYRGGNSEDLKILDGLKRAKRDLITIKSFHVSCSSDRLERIGISGDANSKMMEKLKDRVNGIGIVLYSVDGKSRWTLNSRKCQSGYIVYKRVSNLKGVESFHSQCFKAAFGESFEEASKKHDIIAGGFSYQAERAINTHWMDGFVFNSGTCNDPFKKDKYHIGSRVMNPLEQVWIKTAMLNWSNHERNTKVTSAVTGIVFHEKVKADEAHDEAQEILSSIASWNLSYSTDEHWHVCDIEES